MDLTRPPMSESARNRLERRIYPKGDSHSKSMHAELGNGSRTGFEKLVADAALFREGMELDIAAESLREAETSRGWATRQSLHKEMGDVWRTRRKEENLLAAGHKVSRRILAVFRSFQ